MGGPWMNCEHALLTKYEDLRDNPTKQLLRLVDFLSIDVTDAQIENIIRRYQPKQVKKDDDLQSKLHFNRGKAARYEQDMSPELLERCNEEFAPYLKRMGYPV